MTMPFELKCKKSKNKTNMKFMLYIPNVLKLWDNQHPLDFYNYLLYFILIITITVTN
jgi:hypothetical protein